jgi:hypothetical protein
MAAQSLWLLQEAQWVPLCTKLAFKQRLHLGTLRCLSGQDGPRSSSLLRALSVDPPQPERLHEVVQVSGGVGG